MWKMILLCAFVDITAGKLVPYDNYKMFRVLPETQEQIEMLTNYYITSKPTRYDLWNMPTTTNTYVDIMVHPKHVEWFKREISSIDMNYTILEDNVQMLIDLTTKEGQSSSFDFTSYHSLKEIYKNLDYIAELCPENVTIIVGGSTYEGRQIKGVKISFKPNNPGVFLEGGINAREWMTPAVVMYIIHQLLASDDSKIRNMAESHDWYIFPVFNPDGYVYTHTTDRMWTKTRKLHNNYTFGSSIGSNPNKNWDYKWDGDRFYFNSNTYAGPKPFSEIETKSMSEYIESIKDKFFAYFSFHSQSPDVTYPPDDITNNTMQYELDMVNIAGKSFNVPYIKPWSSLPWMRGPKIKKVVKSSDLDRGSSISYIKGTYNKPLVLAYGLLDNYSFHGFLEPPHRIDWFGEEAICGLEKMLDQAKHIFFNNQY